MLLKPCALSAHFAVGGDPLTHAPQVDELISGLKSLGCASTTGEGQSLCVMSDSFDFNGNARALQVSGDLPSKVDVVKVSQSGCACACKTRSSGLFHTVKGMSILGLLIDDVEQAHMLKARAKQ